MLFLMASAEWTAGPAKAGGLEPATFPIVLGGILNRLNPWKNKKPWNFFQGFCGMDGTRTRDLLRDRQAF